MEGLINASRLEHDRKAAAAATSSAGITIASPWTNCNTMLTNPHMTQEHLRVYHGQNPPLAGPVGQP